MLTAVPLDPQNPKFSINHPFLFIHLTGPSLEFTYGPNKAKSYAYDVYMYV